MNGQNHPHLRQEQILWAIIDEQELGKDEQRHLLECPVCRQNVAQFKGELQEFGQRAKQSVPPFSRQLLLPAAAPTKVSHGQGWLPFLGAAAMAGFVLFFYFMGLQTVVTTRESIIQQSHESLLQDEDLMREISYMVESPFSDDMYEISGDYETSVETDDFMEFIVPDIQDDFQS